MKMPTYPEITELVISNFKSVLYDYCMSDDLREALLRILGKLIELYGKERVAELLMSHSDEEFQEITDEEFEEVFK